jgi:hypothetical protein
MGTCAAAQSAGLVLTPPHVDEDGDDRDACFVDHGSHAALSGQERVGIVVYLARALGV